MMFETLITTSCLEKRYGIYLQMSTSLAPEAIHVLSLVKPVLTMSRS